MSFSEVSNPQNRATYDKLMFLYVKTIAKGAIKTYPRATCACLTCSLDLNILRQYWANLVLFSEN